MRRIVSQRLSAMAVGVVWSLIALALGPARGDDGATKQRWAILSADPRLGGLSDLLTAALSVREDVELVERDQLDLALRELDLSAYFGADDSTRRLHLGQLLKADRLVLLSLREHEQQRFVRLIVSDCLYGARLAEDYRLFEPQQLEQLVNWSGHTVAQTHQRFRGGIEHLVAIPPFLSKNLAHDHDHLQAGYASLVASSLMKSPGVAVVETQEARAIDQELTRSGGELKREIVPVFIEAEFETTKIRANQDPVVRLSIRLKDAKGVRSNLARRDLGAAQVVELLTETLPAQILQQSRDETNVAIGRPQQRRMLIERADVFSQVGAYEHATGLREAALLLAPDDWVQRIALVQDYNRWQAASARDTIAREATVRRQQLFAGERADTEIWATAHAERLARFRRTAPHVEYLVRRRQLNPREAGELASRVVSAMILATRPGENDYGQQDKKALEDFFWNIYPQIALLDYSLRDGTLLESLRRTETVGGDRQSTEPQYRHWTGFAIQMIVEFAPGRGAVGGPPDRNYDDGQTLSHLFRFLTEVSHPDIPISAMAPLSMYRMNQLVASGRLSPGDVRWFFQRLKETAPPLNEFYARCGLLAQDVAQGAPLEALRAEADELLAFVSRWEASNPGARTATHLYRHHLERLRQTIDQRSAEAAPQGPPLPEDAIPPAGPSPGIAFLPIGTPSPWFGLTRCTDSLDLMWSFDRVDVMTAPGSVRSIFQLEVKQLVMSADDMIYSAEWDGRNVWIATMKSGVFVVTPDGEMLARIHSEQGLPPYDPAQLSLYYRARRFHGQSQAAPLRLEPVEPGKCLAIGRFGGSQRLWFAILSQGDDGGYRADVFHTATKSFERTDERRLSDPEAVFPLQWTLPYVDPKHPDRRWVLVGRSPLNFATPWPPLAIDLDALQVSVLPLEVAPAFNHVLPQLAVEGVLWSSAGGTRILIPPSADSGDRWTGRELTRTTGMAQFDNLPPIAHNDAVYQPGDYWHRIRKDDYVVERLNDEPLPLEQRFDFHAASAHYGLVAWNRGDQLYQVLMPAPETMDLAVRYAFVPPEQRERHHRAVEAIRRSGGRVGTRWGVPQYEFQRGGPPQWRTIVYLSEAWSGQDAELAELEGLFHLCELYLVQADVGGEGLRHVGRLKELQALYLIGTQAADSDLAPLQGLANLGFCRLEGRPGEQELGDAALKHLENLPRLRAVMLVGRGFTDAGLAAFGNPRTVQELLLYDTSITPAGIAELKKRKPSLIISGKRAYER